MTTIERNPKISIIRHEVECKYVEHLPEVQKADRVDEVRRCPHGSIQIIRSMPDILNWVDIQKGTTEYDLAFEALDTRTDEDKRRDALLEKIDGFISLFQYLFPFLLICGDMVL